MVGYVKLCLDLYRRVSNYKLGYGFTTIGIAKSINRKYTCLIDIAMVNTVA